MDRLKGFSSVRFHFAFASVIALAGCGTDTTKGITTGTGGYAGLAGSLSSAGKGGSSFANGGASGSFTSGGAVASGGTVAAGVGGSDANGGRAGATSSGGSAGIGGATVASGGSGGAITSDTLFVAPNGDDTNAGTLAQPLRTVAKARDVVRGMTATMKADITVYLRGGTYPQTSTLTFADADSGKNGFYVKYMAYQSERPIITGGQSIKTFAAASAGNGVYAAPGISGQFRQLYVNGVKAIRARSPNLGANGAFAFNRITGADNTAQNIQVAASEVGTWDKLNKVEMHVITGWGDNILRLASLTTSGSTATLKIQSPEAGIVFVRPYPHLGGQFSGFTKHVYYFENALEFLDQPGEWYLDETAAVLYYKPRSGEDMTKATVVAPMLETVMSISGTSTSAQVGYLWFQGITFAHSTFMRPSQFGFCDAQAGQYNLTATSDNKQTIGRPPAGVSVTNANHIHFERNIFTQMGATGLDFISGTHDDMIVGNLVTEIAGNGISIGKFAASDTTEYHVPYNPSDKNEICTSDTIKDNYIHHVTTEFQGGTGIAAGYPKLVDIQHNEVAYTNYTAISLGYGWTDATNAMATNKINNNDIHHAVQILADGAGIYTLSNQQPNSQIQYNYLHDYQTSQWADYGSLGIYLDEQTSGFTIAHNAMVNAPNAVAQNHAGTNAITDTPAANPDSVKSMAGIEADYADIKTQTIPVPSF
ncbi:MAG TPA: right-handed parallel beta-helix repeat-containing protein [Polyangiaceae bacterium]|nr:right-handed parallel beta-helix repeat-containing protein [Polyangiaceae bacterium]